jgi:hypothetical protein
MRKRIVVLAVALAFVAGLGLAAMAASEGSWTGHINDSMCAAKNIDGACAKKCVEEHGAKYVFVNDGDSKIFNLDPQDKVAAHAGHHVTIKGTADGDTIKISEISMAPDKGK